MPRQPHNIDPTIQPGQYSQELPLYLTRIMPVWGQPAWLEADRWRRIVRNQPIAMVCRETLISNVLALDWRIIARDSTQQDELRSEIDYYTRLFDNHNGLDYSGMVEWILGDILDLPFGGAAEIGRMGDRPEGRVAWIKPLDGGTLFPTLNDSWPVGQRIPYSAAQAVYFPDYAISRSYLSPRSDIQREGWGMAPPEKIYLAIESLSRGDMYYAALLLDTPEAGILDLGDMSKDSAADWVNGFRSLLSGVDPFKIPVLYEHTTKTEWIPFGRPPTDLMYDRIMSVKASIVAAGYGMSLGDIGMGGSSNGGETMAGTIRQERKSRKTGFAVAKKKMLAYFNAILPPTLQMKLIDYDDELSTQLGRARLANAQAFQLMIQGGYFTGEEARLQTIADGLVTVPIPESIPESAVQPTAPQPIVSNVSPDSLRPDKQIGKPVPTSQGGYGDVATKATFDQKTMQKLDFLLKEALDKIFSINFIENISPLVHAAIRGLVPQMSHVAKSMNTDELLIWRGWYTSVLLGQETAPDVVLKSISAVEEDLKKKEKKDDWWKIAILAAVLSSIYVQIYEDSLRDSAEEMVLQLFYEGKLANPAIPGAFSIRNNAALMEELTRMAEESLREINDGTLFYMNRTIMSVTKDFLSRPDIASRLKNGESISSIISDTNIVNEISQEVLQELYGLFDQRSEVISEYEYDRIMNMAKSTMFEKTGLKQKKWLALGPDPCKDCKWNSDQGFVPLSFVYRSPMGGIHRPKAHPHCHCDLTYDQDELDNVFDAGNFNLWYGG